MNDLFLGLDCSTQSLTAILINFDSKEILYKHSIQYDLDLPEYKTHSGVIYLEDKIIVHSHPFMWADAMDLLLERMVQDKIPLDRIKAISGSGQQHGTVYLNEKFEIILQKLDIQSSLTKQLKGSLTRNTSPIWMDSSTTKQCKEIREALGGMEKTIGLTGSNTFERFSGPQIRKFYQEYPKDYEKTCKIHLVSSFLASLLVGNNAPIDHGDGAGMNLMNIKTREWDDLALSVTAPDLKDKLPQLVPSHQIIGKISDYFVKKYGFKQNCKIIAFSGDNPNSMIGVGLIEKGKVAISLGSSDTYFGYIENLSLDYQGEGHVFGSPTGDYMSLICYKNGSLAREIIRNKYKLDWESFSRKLEKTPPGNNGNIMLPYFMPEIVPLVLQPKVYRFGFTENDVDTNVRAIIEARFLSMRLHSRWIKELPEEIYATGGASVNKEILKVAADIFKAKIRVFEVSDSAALGAALRAAKSYIDSRENKIEWKDIVKNFLKVQDSEIIYPEPENIEIYDEMVQLYSNYENYILKKGDNPELLRQKFIEKYFTK